MFQISDKLVSLDIAERHFCCDLEACHGQCCIEGDAGAPISPEEEEAIAGIVDLIADKLTPRARHIIDEQGVAYTDEEGDRVTSIDPEGGACVFATFAEGGMCYCAIESARRQGLTTVEKPISCALYPIRVKHLSSSIPDMPRLALNYHRWKICRAAETLGRAKNMRVFEFLREPLIRRFGREWYDELALTCHEYLRQYPSDSEQG